MQGPCLLETIRQMEFPYQRIESQVALADCQIQDDYLLQLLELPFHSGLLQFDRMQLQSSLD